MTSPMSQADIEAQRKALDAVLKNQIEIMGSLSLLLRYVKPDLVGNAGELDIQRAELLDRHKATQAALRQAAKEPEQPGYTQFTGFRP